jgi:translation initiation factor 1 (eIF-1/SUI1)
MKQLFGCGGTVKATSRSVELQGDKFNQSEVYLKELGFILIRSGG